MMKVRQSSRDAGCYRWHDDRSTQLCVSGVDAASGAPPGSVAEEAEDLIFGYLLPPAIEAGNGDGGIVADNEGHAIGDQVLDLSEQICPHRRDGQDQTG